MSETYISEPLISICIPVYNGAKTIGKTLDSLIQQTYKNFEIIVVENCSSDATVQVVQSFQDPRIRLICHDEYLQIGEYNWNRCFQYVQGEYMAIFHADDIYSPEIITRQVECFTRYPQLSAIFTLGYIINDLDEKVSFFELPPGIPGSYPFGFSEMLRNLMEYGVYVITPTAMLPTNLYKQLAPFRVDQFGTASDLDMWLRASECGPVLIIDENLISYRYSVGSGVGSYTINNLRTQPDSKFCVLDQYLHKIGKNYSIPDKSIAKYEFLRLKDSLFRAHNSLRKGEFRGGISVLITVKWAILIKFVISDPMFSYYQLGEYIRSLHSKKPIIQLIAESMRDI